MELSAVSSACVSALIGALLLLLAYVVRQRKEHFATFEKLGIPGPKPSIIWGNFWTIYRKTHVVAQREWHREFGPVVGFFFGYHPSLLIADREVLKSVLLKDFLQFADRSHLFVRDKTRNHFPTLPELRGQRWKAVRTTLTPAFTSSKLKQLSPSVARIVDDFMANVDRNFESGAEFDIYELYKALTLDTICRSALGVKFDIQKDVARSEVLRLMKTLLSFNTTIFRGVLACFPWLTSNFSGELQGLPMRLGNQGKNPIDELMQKCRDVVKMRRRNPHSHRLDLLQLMMDAQSAEGPTPTLTLTSPIAGEGAEKCNNGDNISSDTGSVSSSNGTGGDHRSSNGSGGQCPLSKEKSITEEELIANAFVVLLAGYETTSSTLAFVTRLLLRFPNVQEAIRSEVLEATDNGTVFDFERLQKCHYMESVIQETLRMYPPVHSFTSRSAGEQKTYGKLTIPKNMGVFVSTVQLHYDEEVFPNPYEFQPTRFLPENKTPAMNWAWMPFGAGPRNCIGMRFAQMEIKITLAKLLTKYRLASDREPKGDSHIEVVGKPSLQQIRDPLLCKAKLI